MNTVSAQQLKQHNALDFHYSGRVPGQLIFDNDQQVGIMLNPDQVNRLLNDQQSLFELNLAGSKHLTELLGIRRDPLSKKVKFITLQVIARNRKIISTAKVELIGIPRGITRGGKIKLIENELLVKGTWDQLPKNIEVDVGHLNVGDTIQIKHIKEKYRCHFLASEDTIIARCDPPPIS
jgi:large subunit ribosomal protein L25